MMLHREIKENGKLDVMKVLENGYDPFLCDKCQKNGYCIEKFYKHPEINELIPIPNSESIGRSLIKLKDIAPITDREISNLVNVKTDIKEAATKFGKKLQKAHDLFHQDEFEQASYMYLDIIETRNDITEAWRGLCASFYFMGKFEDAVSACMKINSYIGNSIVDRFIKGCDEKVKSNDKFIERSTLPNKLIVVTV